MGVSTDGEICYGIIFEDEYEFPWDIDHEGDPEMWWISEILKLTYNGYHEKKAILKDNPLPFELVNYCSGEYPMYILAVPGTVKRASRGNPTSFTLDELKVDEAASNKLVEFCKEHDLTGDSEIGWILSSYMG